MRSLAFLLLNTSIACAGGFDRFERDESLLFDEAKTVIDFSGAFAPATGHYDSVDGRSEYVGIGTDVWSGALRIKVTPAEGMTCLTSITQPFATNLDFTADWSKANVVTGQSLRVTEFGASCGYAVPVSGSVLMPLAGLAYNKLQYSQDRLLPDRTPARALDLESGTYSWRAGLGYRHNLSGTQASLVYYSAAQFDVDGLLTVPTAGGNRFDAPVYGRANFPQSLRADLALTPLPGWLLSFAGQWSDWSQLDHVGLKAASATPFWASDTEVLDLKTYFRDGLTASVLLGHAWTPQLATWTRLTWDRATATGWTEHSRSYSLQLGVRYSLSSNIELKAAMSAIWLDDAVLDQSAAGAPYAAIYDGAVMFVPQIGVATRF